MKKIIIFASSFIVFIAIFFIIVFVFPKNFRAFTDSDVTFKEYASIEGIAKGEGAEITIEGKSIDIEKNGKFKVEVPLQLGKNEVTVHYKDNKSEEKLPINITRITKEEYLEKNSDVNADEVDPDFSQYTDEICVGLKLYYGPKRLYAGKIICWEKNHIFPGSLDDNEVTAIKLQYPQGTSAWKEQKLLTKTRNWFIKKDDPALKNCTPKACL